MRKPIFLFTFSGVFWGLACWPVFWAGLWLAFGFCGLAGGLYQLKSQPWTVWGRNIFFFWYLKLCTENFWITASVAQLGQVLWVAGLALGLALIAGLGTSLSLAIRGAAGILWRRWPGAYFFGVAALLPLAQVGQYYILCEFFPSYFAPASWMEIRAFQPLVSFYGVFLGPDLLEYVLNGLILLLLLAPGRWLKSIVAVCLVGAAFQAYFAPKSSLPNAQAYVVEFVPNGQTKPYFPDIRSLGKGHSGLQPKLYVLPESAFNGVFEDSLRLDKLLTQELGPKEFLILGADQRKFGEDGFRYTNSVFFLQSQDYNYSVLSKHFLVPGGEYFPAHWLRKLGPLFNGQKFIYTAGAGGSLDWIGHSWAVAICSESLLPAWYAQVASARPEVFLTVSREYLFSTWARAHFDHRIIWRMAATGKPWFKASGGGTNYLQNMGEKLQSAPSRQLWTTTLRLPEQSKRQ